MTDTVWVALITAIGLAFKHWLDVHARKETNAKIDSNTAATVKTEVKVAEMTEAINGPHTLALETIRDQARVIYESQGGEANRQKLLNAEQALKTHEEGKRK